MKKVLKVTLWILGASGAVMLYQKLDKEFAGAIDTGNWGFVIAWVVCAVLVVGFFWLASKL